MVSSKEINDLLPGSNKHWAGGLYTPTDGRAEPTIAAPAIARAAQRLGAKIFTNTAVRGVETSGGRISAVVTENGSVQCSTVILAGGAWSSTFCRSLDLRLPLLMTIGSVFRKFYVPPGRIALKPSGSGKKDGPSMNRALSNISEPWTRCQSRAHWKKVSEISLMLSRHFRILKSWRVGED